MVKIKKILIIIITLILLSFPGQINAEDQSDVSYQKLLERNQELTKIAEGFKQNWQEAEKNIDELQKENKDLATKKNKFKTLYEQEREDKKEYRQLYLRSQEDLKKTLDSNKRLHSYIDSLNETIDNYLNRTDISVSTSIGINAKNPEESLFIVGFEFGL
jgi:predicted nuclease with TOPRIM domain